MCYVTYDTHHASCTTHYTLCSTSYVHGIVNTIYFVLQRGAPRREGARAFREGRKARHAARLEDNIVHGVLRRAR